MEFVDDVPSAPVIDVGPSPDDTGEVCVGGVESGPEEDGSADDALDGCKGVLEVVGVFRLQVFVTADRDDAGCHGGPTARISRPLVTRRRW